MSPNSDQSEKNRAQYAFNLTLVALAGQVGCLTLLIVMAALFGGLWLDSHFDTRPTFTILLIVGSVPFTLVAMFWVVRKATSRISTPSTTNQSVTTPEEINRGTEE
jgi:F0F1-type ATP synthase assembly protein I